MRPTPLQLEFLRLAGLAGLGLAAGAAAGVPALGALAGLAGFAGWHLAQWRRLRRRPAAAPPHGLPPVWRDYAAGRARRWRRLRAWARERRHLQRQFDALAAALPDAAVVVNPELRLEWFNPAAAGLLGLRDADRGGFLAHVVRIPELVRYLRGEDFSLPLELETFAGAPHPVSVRVTAFGGRARLVTFRDLTQELRLNRLRQEFVANVSHEIRSPLTVVIGYLETLEDRPEAAPDPAIVRRMAREARRMRQLVEDLLELSRLEAGELRESDLQEVALRPLATEVRAEAQAQTSDALHRIELEGDAELRVRGRPEELHSALLNLVSNALRYSPDGGAVTIAWEGRGDRVRLSVRDEGVGIAAEHIARLTERFYRVDKARSRGTGGTGLGLAIVKHILSRHGGRLQIESRPGRGSTFTCVFPRRPEAA